MVIDEINRANLPKVFGEMLFLLEYREERVRTLYRAEEAFELPSDIWFIGTMNTADRSIALVDAALRRRFHFIPFFPDREPMAGLLGRWLEREVEPGWVAELVEMVNADLMRDLGGPHLQIGPSHFMQHGLDEAALRRIWAYNVVPFIEDQLFGEPARIRSTSSIACWPVSARPVAFPPRFPAPSPAKTTGPCHCERPRQPAHPRPGPAHPNRPTGIRAAEREAVLVDCPRPSGSGGGQAGGQSRSRA